MSGETAPSEEIRKLRGEFEELRSSLVQTENLATQLQGRFDGVDEGLRGISRDVTELHSKRADDLKHVSRSGHTLALALPATFFVALLGSLYFMSTKIERGTAVLQDSIKGVRTEVSGVRVDLAGMKPDMLRLAGIEGALRQVQLSVAAMAGTPSPPEPGEDNN